MNDIGWVKVYRQTLDSDFWLIEQPFSFRDAFFYVLLAANRNKATSYKNGHTIDIQRGQLLTSIRKLGVLFHWDKHKVYRWLRFMAATDMIKAKSVGFGTLLTIVNYNKYQGEPDTPTHTPTHEVAHKDTHEPTHDNAHTPTHEVAPRSKKEEERRQKEENKSPADAGTPPADNEPPIGSPEWYKLHYDDDWGDEE